MNTLRSFLSVGIVILLGIFTATTSHAASSSLEWVYQVGSTANDKGTAVTTDADGNIYVASRTQNASVNVDLDPTEDTDIFASGSGDEIFLSKYAQNGTYMWSIQFPSSGNSTEIYDLAVDTDRNRIYAVGSFTGTVDFDPGENTTSVVAVEDDGFLVALNLNGEYIDHKIFSGEGADRIVSVDVNSNGDVFLSGWFRGSSEGSTTINLNPDGEFLVVNEGESNFTETFVVKYNNSLTFSWAKAYEATSYVIIRGVAAGADNDSVYLIGRYYGTTELDEGVSLTSTSGSSDSLVIKLAGDGSFLWSQTTLSSNFEDAYRGAVDSDNNIYFVGEFYAPSMDFDPTENEDIHYADENDQGSAFVSKYASNGTYLWTRSWGGDSYDSAGDLLVTDDDSVIVMSRSSSLSVDLDGTTGEDVLENESGSDIGLISMYSPNGAYGFGFPVGRSTNDYINAEQWAIAASGSRLYVVGQAFGENIDFGLNGEELLISAESRDTVFSAYTFDTHISDDSEENEESESDPGTSSRSKTRSRKVRKAPTCTAADPTSAPDLFQIDTENGSATLYFSPASGPVSSYHVSYGFVPGLYFFGTTVEKMNDNKGVQQVTINHLMPYVSYNFKVMAVNDCAPGPWSQDLSVKVLNKGKQSSFFY